MKRLLIALTVLAVTIPVVPVYAQSGCEAAARRAASSRGGKVLRVQTRGNRCVITLLVPRGNGAPKRVRVTVPRS